MATLKSRSWRRRRRTVVSMTRSNLILTGAASAYPRHSPQSQRPSHPTIHPQRPLPPNAAGKAERKSGHPAPICSFIFLSPSAYIGQLNIFSKWSWEQLRFRILDITNLTTGLPVSHRHSSYRFSECVLIRSWPFSRICYRLFSIPIYFISNLRTNSTGTFGGGSGNG